MGVDGQPGQLAAGDDVVGLGHPGQFAAGDEGPGLFPTGTEGLVAGWEAPGYSDAGIGTTGMVMTL